MALGYDGTIRVDVLVRSDGFAKGLQDMSEELDKQVKKAEKRLEDLLKKREEAAAASLGKDAALDAGKSRLLEMKKEWQQIQELSENVRLPETVRSEAAAQLPEARERLNQQLEDVERLQQEYDKIAASVGKYDEEIAAVRAELESQRNEARQAAEAFTNAQEELAGIGRSAEIGDQYIVDLSRDLAELQKRQETLENAGLGLGFREYDENVRKIAGITARLKEYQTALKESGELSGWEDAGGRLMETLQKIGTSFSGGGLGGTRISEEWRELLGDLGDGLRQAAEEVREAWNGALETVRKKAAALGSAFAGAVRAGAAVGKSAWEAAKGFAGLLKNGNGFAGLIGSLPGKLERLGSALKRALADNTVDRCFSMLRQEMSAYLAVNQQFEAALARIRGVLLTAFQPVYEAALPALLTLMNLLTNVIAAVSHFTASLFGTTAKKAQKNAEALYREAHALDAVGSAAKKAETALAPFDAFNILHFPESGGGGGSGGIEMPDFDYEYEDTAFDSWGEAFSAFLDKLLDGLPRLEGAFKNFADWLNDLAKKLYGMFTFPGVLEKVKLLGTGLAEALNKLVNWIDWETLGRALGAGLNLALNFLTSFLYGFDWMNLGRKLAEFVNGLAAEIDWYEFGRLLWAGFKIALETLAGFILGLDMPLMAEAASHTALGFFDEMKKTIERIPWGEIGGQIARFLNHIKWYDVISSVLAAVSAAITAVFQTIRGVIDTLQWHDIAARIYTAINDSFGQIDWQEIGRTLGDLFIRAFEFLREVIAGIDWYQIGADVGRFLIGIDWAGVLGGLAGVIAAGLNAAIQAVRGLIDTISPNIREIARGIAEKINEFFRSVDWAGAGRVISDGLEMALDFAIEFLRTVDWESIGRNIVTLLENIDWGSLLTKWSLLVGEAMTAKLSVINLDGIVEIGGNIAEGLLKGILDKIASIGTWLKENLVDPIVNGVKELFGIHSPSTVMAEIGENLVAGLLQGVSENWNSIVEFLREGAGEIRNLLAETWENIRAEAAAAWERISTALRTVWENLKENAGAAFENIRAAITAVWENVRTDTAAKWGEIQTSVAEKVESIKSKVSEGFGNVKSTVTGKMTEAMNELKGKDWSSVGRSMADGILNGLQGIFSRLSSWASQVWSSITSAFSDKNARSTVSRSAGSSRSAAYSLASVPDGYAAYSLPKLANGAVIPPNQQFMAILGDQRSGMNVEAPVGTIKQAVSEAIRDMGGFGGDIHITVESVLDGKVVARNTVHHINDMTRSAGKPVLLY